MSAGPGGILRPGSYPAAGIPVSGVLVMEKRQSVRYQVEASAIMRVQGRVGPFLVTILDVSATGLRLSSSTPFESGTKVTITFNKANVTGEIRYARNVSRGEFNIGVLADGASPEALLPTGEMDLTLLFRERIHRR